MSRIWRMICSFALCSLFVLVPHIAYASEISSVHSSYLSVIEEADPNFIIKCVHKGDVSFQWMGPLQIDVVVTNHVTEAFFIPCTDIMSYTLFYEIIDQDGSKYNEGIKTGSIGRNLSERWSFGGLLGKTLRCRLVTSIHLQTITYDWVETRFVSVNPNP